MCVCACVCVCVCARVRVCGAEKTADESLVCVFAADKPATVRTAD
jgi:hypothetical protein